MFITDLGSEAYQNIYDLIELDNQLMLNTVVDKSLPLTITREVEPRVDAILNLREMIDNEIATWLKLVAKQEGGRKDVDRIDAGFDNLLSERGTLDAALNTEVTS